MTEPKYKIGQVVKTTKAQEYDNGIEDSGYLPKGSIGVIVEYRDFETSILGTFEDGYQVDFDGETWAILENELEAMESE